MELYIHIPFCRQKCRYCDFASWSGQESLMGAYVDALLLEAEAMTPNAKSAPIETVFIGGGTPSILPAPLLTRLLHGLRQHYSIPEGVEFTSEANPGTLTEEWLAAALAGGVNRLSMGMQAAQADLLRTLGRIHSQQDVADSVRLAREMGVRNLSLDLMFGLPGQTPEMWRASIDAALSLSPEHMSCYGLIPEDGTPLDVSFLFGIQDGLRSHAELFYAPRHPQKSPDIDERKSILDQVAEKDVLLHYPYQSIRPFLTMLTEAAHDPQVTAIQMTLYRLARDSKVVEALVEAAENGKKVDVLVELKARFDEENNIEWSRRLERAGCHVIYGVERLKVHSKLCLITRETEQGTQYITQIGTGNYNEKTARLYTDLSYITAREEIGRDALMVFEALLEGETVDHMQTLLVAPHCLQNKLIDLIDGEIAKVALGQPGHIRLKMNSLTDKTLIDKLVEASKAGVQIDMIVRGICCLRGGVAGETDNIRIISVVGRFLEHSRIYIFGEGAEAKQYISSADWMTRNTLRRVEVAAPILDEGCKARIERIFDVIWRDNVQAREQQPDGNYRRRYPGVNTPVSSQNWLYDEAYRMASSNK